MNHKTVSLVKSLLRIIGYLFFLKTYIVAILLLILAEVLGIIEEEYEK